MLPAHLRQARADVVVCPDVVEILQSTGLHRVEMLRDQAHPPGAVIHRQHVVVTPTRRFRLLHRDGLVHATLLALLQGLARRVRQAERIRSRRQLIEKRRVHLHLLLKRTTTQIGPARIGEHRCHYRKDAREPCVVNPTDRRPHATLRSACGDHFLRRKRFRLHHRRCQRPHVAHAPDPRGRVAGVLGFEQMLLHPEMQRALRLHRIDRAHANHHHTDAMLGQQLQHRAIGQCGFQCQAHVPENHVLTRPALCGRAKRDRQPHRLPRPPLAHCDLDQLLPNSRMLRRRLPLLNHPCLQRRGIANGCHVEERLRASHERKKSQREEK